MTVKACSLNHFICNRPKSAVSTKNSVQQFLAIASKVICTAQIYAVVE